LTIQSPKIGGNSVRKIYQTKWHGIPFKSFSTLSTEQLAESEFYKSFYKIFFQRYSQWEDLDSKWVQLKLQTTQFLKERNQWGREGKILSIGCGIGVIEKALIDEGLNNLEITEISKDSLLWLQPYISYEKTHIGFFPGCLPEANVYDFVYLGGVEYFFNQSQLVDFLKDVKSRLSPKGKCLLISWSFEPNSSVQLFINTLKDIVKYLLEKIKIRTRGQFWGYSRNRKEFHAAMKSAGFKLIEDGLFEKKTQWNTYWIEGSNE
jgi:SAM-dependent methyltransferase